MNQMNVMFWSSLFPGTKEKNTVIRKNTLVLWSFIVSSLGNHSNHLIVLFSFSLPLWCHSVLGRGRVRCLWHHRCVTTHRETFLHYRFCFMLLLYFVDLSDKFKFESNHLIMSLNPHDWFSLPTDELVPTSRLIVCLFLSPQITFYEGKCFTGRKLEVRGDCDNFQDRGFMNRWKNEKTICDCI